MDTEQTNFAFPSTLMVSMLEQHGNGEEMTREEKIEFLIDSLVDLKEADQEEAEVIFAEIGAESHDLLETLVYYLEGRNA